MAAQTQVPIVNELERLREVGVVHHYRSLWIVNAIAATISPEAINALASLPEIERIENDERHDAFDKPPGSGSATGNYFHFVGWAAAPDVKPGQAANWSIAQTRAPHVWNLLGIDGAGVTVAIVDTGVDWRHPALRNSYRGAEGEEVRHEGNWYSAVQPTQTVPVDPHGHGTHVAGTAVGSRGIGVAPGARWIAVAIADESGRIHDSDVHAAFQWLLTPDGKPELAPDVVNNSWGTSGDYLAFRDDVRILQAAGIISVFAAGNSGPNEGTITAPASYTGTISVAATDIFGSVAWFSSRGPSPLTPEAKPLLAAPGTQILSAYPDNRYALFNGTSMAAPHVTGAIALMLSAEPRLSTIDVIDRLTASAGTIHDPARGWGLLDIYDLVAPLATTGRLQGRVTSATAPIAGAVVALTTPSGAELTFTTDAEGRYEASVSEGVYNVRATAFGYRTAGISRLHILDGHVAAEDIVLDSLPAGELSVALLPSHINHPSNGGLTLIAQGRIIPALPTRGPDGQYVFDLPAGQYTIEARVPGFRVQTDQVDVYAEESRQITLELEPGPRLLLVDSGLWQYRSQATYFDEALRDLDYFADRWPIADPYAELPTVERLAGYDAVIWSAPFDSPGYLNANDVITDYLEAGGRLLITGQNVGNYDGAPGTPAIWWARNLEAKWVDDVPPDLRLAGTAGTPFANLTLSLNGNDSARNQITPDRVTPLGGSLTRPVLLYEDGTAAALSADRCEPFRLIYLGFGLEGVTGRSARADLLRSSLDALLTPPPETDALWQPTQVSDYALGGERLLYTSTLQNLNQTLTRTFQIDSSGGAWPRSILTPTLRIGPCEAAETVLTLEVPTGLQRDQLHELSLTAVAEDGSATASPPVVLTLTHKTPGSVLLVDDDRFFNVENIYGAALNRLGITYDVWETGWQDDVRGSPRAEFLQAYDLVIWFTGYDWYQPINSADSAALIAFLDGGGRLFLSSQDYLSANKHTSTPRDYFGVAGHQESITPTHIFADDQIGLPSGLTGPLPLRYDAYQNYSDGLIPTAEAVPFLWHNQGSLAGTALSGSGSTGLPWRTVFWALPFEAVPDGSRSLALQSIIGQLSDIGDSRFTVNRRSGSSAKPRVYDLVLTNSGAEPRRLWLTNTLPVSLTLQRMSDGLVYDSNRRELRWEGVLNPGESRSLHYTASVVSGLKSGERIDNSVAISSAALLSGTIGFFDHFIMTRTTTTWVDTADLSQSRLIAAGSVVQEVGGLTENDEEVPAPVQLITYSLVLGNTGLTATGPMSATVSMPRWLGALKDTLSTTAGSARLEGWRMVWEGRIAPGETVTASVTLTETAGVHQVFPAAAYVYDQATHPIVRPSLFRPLPYESYLPLSGAWP